MATWTEIFPDVDGPPVVGLPSEFTSVASSFTKMHDDATEILQQFARIMGGGEFDEIQGEVAEPFRNFVKDVNDRLQSLPDVSCSAAGIFTHHADRLAGFRTSAATALDQATTKWTKRKELTGQLSSAKSAQTTAQQKVDNAPPDADPASSKQLQDDQQDAADQVTKVQGQITTLDGELKTLRGTWTKLRGDEDELRKQTKKDLGDIDLHSLKDPGWFDSFCESVGAVVEWAYKFTGLEDLVALIDAIASGDWAAALWRLRDLLDKVFVVLSIVALIACPALLLTILVVIAVAKLAIDVALYASNTADPKTGRRISAMDLAFDVFDAATAGRAAQLKEASVLAKGKEMYAGAATYAGRRSAALGRNGTAFGSTIYSKSAVGSQQKLLRSFGIDSTRIIYTQGKNKAVYSLAAHVSPTFVIGKTQEMVLKPVAVAGYGAVQGQEATKGPEVEQIEQSMDTDAPRPYFTQPSGARVIDILAEAHK